MTSYLFKELEIIKKNEPISVINYLDSISFEHKSKMFPSFLEYYQQSPDELMTLIVNGIKNDDATYVRTVKGMDEKTQTYSSVWNTIALTYMHEEMFEKSKLLFQEMIRQGTSDPSTLNNFGVVLIQEIVKTKKIIPDNIIEAKKAIFQAFTFDMDAKLTRSKKFIRAALLPAFKNLIFIRSIESELFFQQKRYFFSFILSWLSIEMSLNRIWLQYMENNGYSNAFRSELMRNDIKPIIDTLFVLDIIDENTKNTLHRFRSTRNDILHGMQFDSTIADARNCLKMSRQLIPILNS